jgi:hypothetical protein
MDGPEIRQRINEINAEIFDLIGKFVLTDQIKKLAREKGELQAHCQHQFENGLCIYCDLSEEEAE